MDSNYAALLSASFKGNLIESGGANIEETIVQIERLNNILIKVSFELDFGKIVFRALVSKHKEGLMLFVQNRIAGGHILSGQSGFLNEKPHVHGGYNEKLDSIYFNIKIASFSGSTRECYFIGEKTLQTEESLAKTGDSRRTQIDK
ncbi:MAG: hypothetical protein JXR03_19425 [Cyclobacteriaceae bacterium]